MAIVISKGEGSVFGEGVEKTSGSTDGFIQWIRHEPPKEKMIDISVAIGVRFSKD
jgi:hypothetical protein